MAKRSATEAFDNPTGYIANVTPIKEAQNKRTRYFTADLQASKEKTERIVCFSPEKHQMFSLASESNYVYEIQNAKISPGRDNVLDVKCFKQTELLKSKKTLDFNKNYKQNVELDKPISTPSTLLEAIKEYQLATIDVKIISSDKTKMVSTKYGLKPVTNYTVADCSKTSKMAIWNNELAKSIITAESYNITNVLGRTFDGEIQVSTTSTTKVKPITTLENVAEITEDFGDEFHIDVTSVAVQKQYSCSVCFSYVNIEGDKGLVTLVRCNKCNFKQLVTNLQTKTKVMINHENNNLPTKLSLDNDVLTAFLEREDKTSLTKDDDALEDFIILNKKFKVFFKNNSVEKIERQNSK